ncbi:PSD1 and planctomycete cytochrome C domain-containing protein [Lignipirellula cremea]|uniref:PSD1 and planctomycete cytochrome C domain-containing protein n=1 Tax=Lignipirellula cremea TaxID=2528010 RepID=UPI0018D242BD|nr:PSD1 and planctomycete cytochrome C domain-containing protein [Lignipirellula cremea]
MLLLLLPGIHRLQAAEVDYTQQIRPLLKRKCWSCHGPLRQEAGLRTDTAAALLQGGDSGPALQARQPDDSLILERVAANADERMPPKGEPLTAAEQSLLRRWIAAGAPAPRNETPQRDPRNHWAFQSLAVPPPGVSPDHVPTAERLLPSRSVDAWIEERLQEQGLERSPPADATSLLRRMFFDLHGLPPTPAEISVWLPRLQQDRKQGATALLDYLLASPRYGERWAQHWLDLVRYADTHGYEVNTPRPHAWPYRDYVIRAFNQDTPYDRFLTEQLTGDQLGVDAATGFLVAAPALLPGQIGKDEASKRLARQDALDEIVVGVSATFLGLTVGCARCHDHKFDPIRHEDYYAMQAFFAGVDYGDRKLGQEPSASKLSAKEPPGKKTAGKEPAANLVYAGKFREPDTTSVLKRGDPEQPGKAVGPGVPAILGSVPLDPVASEPERRQALAAWIASPANPLTARVMANRIWQHHFGAGLVETPSDFGLNGAAPSHPELLDWLAQELIDSGWSIKYLHRRIVLSETYQQASRFRPEAAARDGDNRLLWRYPTRRIEAEAIRDSILQCSGELELQMGGPGFDFFEKRGGLSGFPPLEVFGPAEKRRMIYAHKIRMESAPVFGAFDCPDAGQATPLRSQSTTAIQALNLFNSPFLVDQSQRLAERVKAEAGASPVAQIEQAFQLTLARPPRASEAAASLQVVQQHGLPALCRVLFNSSEFLFLP